MLPRCVTIFKYKMKISIILLAHNEEKNISYEIESIKKNILNKLDQYELIIVEDGSTDKTREIILEKKKAIDFIYFTSEVRRGSKDAMLESFKIATGDYVFIADSGRKFDFNDFWKLHEHITKNDLVSGLRTHRQDQFYRIILTKLFNLFLKITLNSKFTDCDSGFKIYNNKILKKIIKNEVVNPNFISAELCLKIQYCGLKFKEVPINYFQRDEVSKASPPYKIPGLIINFFLNFLKFRKQLITINSK